MNNIITAIWAESVKIRKSKVFIVTIGLFIFIPLMFGALMYLFMNPELAEKMGIIGTKAKMFGENDWPGFMSLLNQAHASIGLIAYGFVTVWIFGREHSDKTMKDILVLPVSRSVIVTAKLIAGFFWCLFLSLIMLIVSVSFGFILGLPGYSNELMSAFVLRYSVSALLTLLLSTPVSYLTGLSRGYFAPLGFLILTMILAQIVGVLGLAPYFPWAVPGLYSVAAEAEGMLLLPVSYVLLAGTFILFYWMTVRWWIRSDHH